MCKEFTTVNYDEVSESSFIEELDKYKEEKAEEEKRANSIFNKIAKFISKYRWIFITVIIVAIAFAVVYFINRKKSRLV
jgi:cell division protein FtsL